MQDCVSVMLVTVDWDSGNTAAVLVSLMIDKIIGVARGTEVSVAMIWPSVASY